MRITITLFCLLTCLPTTPSVLAYTFGILGDAGHWNDATRKVRESMRAGGVRELILPGDNLYFANNYDVVWSHWRDFLFSLVAIGNHTLSYEAEVQYFGMPGEYYTKKYGENVLFVVLNSDRIQEVPRQIDWLRDTLLAARERHVFIVLHHPPYKIGMHNWEEKREFQESFRQIINDFQSKITLVIAGHDHTTGLYTIGDTAMVVSGATFEARIPLAYNYRDFANGTQVSTRWLGAQESHWTRLDVDSSTGDVWLNFVRGRDSHVVCSAKLIGGPDAELSSRCR